MTPSIDVSGQRFGMLIVLEKTRTESGLLVWRCLCDCGNVALSRAADLRRKWVQSCGCLQAHNRHIIGSRTMTHNKRKTPEYRVWLDMRRRCDTPSQSSYRRYGGRGIKVCARWNISFESFLDDMGKRPSSVHSIERKDTNGNYEPENCRWATVIEQANNRRNNRLVEYRGKRMSVADLARTSGTKVIYHTILRRLNAGLSAEDAVR